jgi:ribosomal protein S18 acetylase RimI-like enzyme
VADNIEIRPFVSADRDEFAELVASVLSEYGFSVDPVLEADLVDPTASYDSIWIAAAGEKIVGSVAVRLLTGGTVAELKRMYVDPAHRGHGLGNALLQRAISSARDQQCHEIVLDTATAMTAAQQLYESAGFARTGTRTETGAQDSRCEVLYQLKL